MCFVFWQNVKTYPLLENESTIWLFMSLVRCKVLPQQGICTMSILKTFLMFPSASKLLTVRGLHSKCWFSSPVGIQGTCDMTLHLDGVHICHILKYWFRILYRYSLSAKKWDENVGQNGLFEGIYVVKADSHVFESNVTRKTQRAQPFVLSSLEGDHIRLVSSRFVASEHCSCVIFCFDIHS